jgi:hypothetical protein
MTLWHGCHGGVCRPRSCISAVQCRRVSARCPSARTIPIVIVSGLQDRQRASWGLACAESGQRGGNTPGNEEHGRYHERRARASARLSMFATCGALHSRPRGVGMPRAVSAAAMARNEVAPVAFT